MRGKCLATTSSILSRSHQEHNLPVIKIILDTPFKYRFRYRLRTRELFPLGSDIAMGIRSSIRFFILRQNSSYFLSIRFLLYFSLKCFFFYSSSFISLEICRISVIFYYFNFRLMLLSVHMLP